MSVKLGQYELFEPLGEGRTAAVFRAMDPSRGMPVAVKLINEDIAQTDPEYVGYLIQEAAASAELDHPGITKVYYAGEEGGLYLIVMELLEGNTLERIIAGHGPMQEAAVLAIASQIAGALRAAYAAHMMHGDIKPRNIFITQGGGVKLLDFGLGKGAGIEDAPEKDGTIAQSAYYIAPERTGSEARDFRSDIYSLGAVLFYALTGQPPILAGSVEELAAKRQNEKAISVRRYNPHISVQTEHLIAKMLEKSSILRYLDYYSLIADITAAGAKVAGKSHTPKTTPAPVAPAPAPAKPVKAPVVAGEGLWGGKRKLSIIVGGSVIFLLIGWFILFLLFHKSSENKAGPNGREEGSGNASSNAAASATPIADRREPAGTTSSAARSSQASSGGTPSQKPFSVKFTVPRPSLQNTYYTIRAINLMFSEPVDRASLGDVKLTGEGVAGLSLASYYDSNKQARYTILGSVKKNQRYTITVPVTVRSAKGEPLREEAVCNFTTEKETVSDFPAVLYDDAFAGKGFVFQGKNGKIDMNNTESPHSGSKAIKIVSSDSSAGSAMFFAGSSSSGTGRIGFDLSKYKSMEFWVKGNADGIDVWIGNDMDGTNRGTQIRGITNQYQRFTALLPDHRESIGTLLTIKLPQGKTIYIDDIKLLP